MEDEDVYPDILHMKPKSNINNELKMYITTGPPDPPSRPSQSAVMRRAVERPQDGVYELAGGGNVTYNLTQRNVSIKNNEEGNAHKNCFQAHQKKIGLTILIIIVLGISAGVGVKFGLFATSQTKDETGRYYLLREIGSIVRIAHLY